MVMQRITEGSQQDLLAEGTRGENTANTGLTKLICPLTAAERTMHVGTPVSNPTPPSTAADFTGVVRRETLGGIDWVSSCSDH